MNRPTSAMAAITSKKLMDAIVFNMNTMMRYLALKVEVLHNINV